MANDTSGNSMFDQDATRTPSPRAPRGGLIASVLALGLVVAGAVFLLARPGGERVRTPADLTGAVSSPAPASTVAPTTTLAIPPTTEPPPTTAPATTAPPTTVPPTTAPPPTTPPTTAPQPPPTTAPPTAAAGPTTTLPLWSMPPSPDGAPPDGPGSPQILHEVFASGVRAVDAEPFLLRTQLLADAWASGDFDLARSIDLRSRAGAAYEERFADLDRSSLILVDAGVSGGSYELLVIEVNVESGGDVTRLHCAQYVAEGTTGNVVRRGGFELGTYDRNITPEELRNATDVVDGLLDRCTFGQVAATSG